MSKVGRAAYSASRARLELVTADKTISKNESGELYLVFAGEDPLTITLPSDAEEGTRYSFWIPVAPGADIILSSPGAPGSTGAYFGGAVSFADGGGAGVGVVDQVVTMLTGPENTLTIQDDAEPGSWIDCVYVTAQALDSPTGIWFVCGFISGIDPPVFTDESPTIP